MPSTIANPMIIEMPEWKTFDTLSALNSFRDYWQENESLIHRRAKEEEVLTGPKWTPQTDEEYAEFHEERRVARHLQDEIMLPTFRHSCVVMLYAIVERELLRLVRNLEKERGVKNSKFKSQRGALLKPVTVFCEKSFQLRLEICPDYNTFCDLQQIRDCIVHCRGEVDLFDPPKRRSDLISMKDRREGFFALQGTNLDIEAVCIDRFTRDTWRFFSWTFRELNWKIDDTWREKKWP